MMVASDDTFDIVIIVVIVVSSCCLAADSPRLQPTSDLYVALRYLDLAWTAIFSAECAVKVVAFGFVSNGKRSYLRDPWNVLDFSILLISLVMLLGIPQAVRGGQWGVGSGRKVGAGSRRQAVRRRELGEGGK